MAHLRNSAGAVERT